MSTIFHPDTLSLIFTFLYDESPTPLTTTTLRSVSSSWMALAGSIPHLWMKIVLDRPSHFTDIDRTRLYIQKSGIHLLDLRLSLDTDLDLKTKETGDVVTILRENVARFRAVEIHASEHEHIEAFLSIGEEKAAPNLEELNITIDLGPNRLQSMRLCAISPAFTPSPRLKRLRIPIYPTPTGNLPHFLDITSLSLDGTIFELSNLVRILALLAASAPQLEDFKYTASGHYECWITTNNTPQTSISFPCLRWAEINLMGNGIDMLRQFVAPQLAALRLEGRHHIFRLGSWDERLGEPISHVLAQLSTHSPLLMKLTLVSIKLRLAQATYGRILGGEMFPGLEEFALDTTDIQDESLVPAAGQVSSLRKLVLLGCQHITGPALLRYVNGKDQDFAIVVKDCDGISKHDLEDMRRVIMVA